MVMIQTTLRVRGMSCGNCVRHVTEALQQVPGVQTAEVALAEHAAHIVHDPDEAPVGALVAAVEEAGYTAEV